VIDKLPLYEHVSKTVEELIAERDRVYELDKDEDLEAIHAYERKKQQDEKEHQDRLALWFKGSSVSQWALRNASGDNDFVKEL
jgi:hypothetical protein